MDLRPQTQTSIAIAGDFFTILALAAPLFTAMPAIYKADTVGRRSPLPNIAACLSCCVGILYGCARDDRLAIAVSAIGASLQAVYVAFFIWYSAGAARRLVLLQCLVPALAYLVTLAVYLVGVADTNTLAFMAGACGCIVPATIAYNLVKVNKDKSMECMPHPIVPALSLVSASLWILYAYAGKDPKLYVAVPNYLGLASALIQLCLHCHYGFQSQLKSDVDAALRECLLDI